MYERNGTVSFYYGLRQEQIMLEDSVLERDNLAPHELESLEPLRANELESQELESLGSVPAVRP